MVGLINSRQYFYSSSNAFRLGEALLQELGMKGVMTEQDGMSELFKGTVSL